MVRLELAIVLAVVALTTCGTAVAKPDGRLQYGPFASGVLTDPDIQEIVNVWQGGSSDQSTVAAASAASAGLKCEKALGVLAGCPLVPSNWQNAGVLSTLLAANDVLPMCCAAAKTFHQLRCDRKAKYVEQLQTIMGNLTCPSASNGWKVVGSMCDFKGQLMCTDFIQNSNGSATSGRHLLQDCGCGTQCCSKWGYCGCGSEYCNSDSRHGGCNCFPASASVQTPSGPKPMSDLNVGDVVAVVSADGQQTFEEVFFFSHKLSNKRGVYMGLTTASGKTLFATPDHLVLAMAQSDEAHLVEMGAIEIGDKLWTSAGNGQAMLWENVVKVEYAMMDGAYHPHTASGTIVVDGVAASCYTTHIQFHSTAFGNAIFAPFKLLYKWLGVKNMIKLNTWILSFGAADSTAMPKITSTLRMVKYGAVSWLHHSPQLQVVSNGEL